MSSKALQARSPARDRPARHATTLPELVPPGTTPMSDSSSSNACPALATRSVLPPSAYFACLKSIGPISSNVCACVDIGASEQVAARWADCRASRPSIKLRLLTSASWMAAMRLGRAKAAGDECQVMAETAICPATAFVAFALQPLPTP